MGNTVEKLFKNFVHFLDCYDFNVSIAGAADTRIEGLVPNNYTYVDDIPFTIHRFYSCAVIGEISSWRHFRYVNTHCHVLSSPL